MVLCKQLWAWKVTFHVHTTHPATKDVSGKQSLFLVTRPTPSFWVMLSETDMCFIWPLNTYERIHDHIECTGNWFFFFHTPLYATYVECWLKKIFKISSVCGRQRQTRQVDQKQSILHHITKSCTHPHPWILHQTLIKLPPLNSK